MALVQNTLIGRARKSVGGTTFQTWKSLNVLRSKPFEVKQNVTAAVQLNRDKFSTVGGGVSQITGSVKRIYNFGIRKTTEYADSVKFFRDKILDTLKLDPTLLAGTKFGTGNAVANDMTITTLVVDAVVLTIVPNTGNAELNTADAKIDILVVNDDMSKVAYIQDAAIGTATTITLDLTAHGFVDGDKVCFGKKVIKFKAGNDLATKVKFVDTPSFSTLTE